MFIENPLGPVVFRKAPLQAHMFLLILNDVQDALEAPAQLFADDVKVVTKRAI